MWKEFGLRAERRDRYCQQQGRPQELQAEPGKAGSTNWEEKSTGERDILLRTNKHLLLTPCISRILFMAGTNHQAKERVLNNKSWTEA